MSSDLLEISIMRYMKILAYAIAVLVLLLISLVCYIHFALPNVGEPEDIAIDITQERIERGRYLANYVTVCTDCHSTRDWHRFSGPLVPGTVGRGGEVFDESLGFPGKFYSRNITSAAIGDWTDGEILRAITSGVNKYGEPLFSVMPHASYGKMDREDLYAIIAYLRTLKPIDHTVPPSVPSFPMNLILNTIPKRAEFSKMPDRNDRLAYGAYLFNAATCEECHTKRIKGKPIEGMELAGGFEFPLITGGVVRSANITPDVETGIGGWSEEDFVGKFKEYGDPSFVPASIHPGDFNTMMPWTMYGKMEEEDLRAIYAYLKTRKPITNQVVRFTE